MQEVQHIYSFIRKSEKIIDNHASENPMAMLWVQRLGYTHFLVAGGHQVQVISPTNWAVFKLDAGM